MKAVLKTRNAIAAVLAILWALLPAEAQDQGTPSSSDRHPPGVLFVFDSSGSMQKLVQGKPKIEVARTVMADVARSLSPGVQVGLLSFGHRRKGDCTDIEVLAPVGSDRSGVLNAVSGLKAMGETPLTDAIKLAAAQFKEYEGPSSVVVVSDGKEECRGDPCAAAREAVAAGVHLRIHVVGFDVTPDEAKQLQCIAKEGKGKYFTASNSAELSTALGDLGREVASPQPPSPPTSKVVKIGLGAIKIPNMKEMTTTVDVYEQETGKKVGSIGFYSRTLQIPSGTYKLLFAHKLYREGVNVVPGKTTEFAIGTIKMPNIGHGASATLYEQDSGTAVGRFGDYEHIVDVAPGTYRLKMDSGPDMDLAKDLVVEPNQELILE